MPSHRSASIWLVVRDYLFIVGRPSQSSSFTIIDMECELPEDIVGFIVGHFFSIKMFAMYAALMYSTDEIVVY
jgi:hypothetical protein